MPLGVVEEMAVRTLFSAIALSTMIGISGCTSLHLGTALKLRALDFFDDDVAELLVAFEVPDNVQPISEASHIQFDVTTAELGERHVTAELVPAVDASAAANLTPPLQGRRYHLLAFADDDKAAIREAQQWVRELKAAHSGPLGGRVDIAVRPRFCSMGGADPTGLRFSVLIALTGEDRLEPLIVNESLSRILDEAGVERLPDCA